MEVSIFSFVVVHNRKIPRTELTKLTYTWAGYKKINWKCEVDNENDEIFSPWVEGTQFQKSVLSLIPNK